MWRGIVLAALCLWPSIALAQDYESQDAQDHQSQDAKAAKDAEERKAAIEDAFVSSITTDALPRHVFHFGSGQPTIVVYAGDELLRGGSPEVKEPSLRKPDPIDEVYEHGFGVRLRAADRDYFEMLCHAGVDTAPFCRFSSGSARDNYDIAGELFVIPGNGCIYSHGGDFSTMGTPYDVSGLNCSQGGELKPDLWPFGHAAASRSGI